MIGVAAGVRDAQLGDYHRAATALFRHPVVTVNHPGPDTFGLIRRFEEPLRVDLAELCGHRIEVTDTCARLVRTHDRLDLYQRLRVHRSSGWRDFDRRRLTYMALVLCVLDTVDMQVTLRDIAAQLTTLVAEELPQLGFDQTHQEHRRALIDVLTWLETIGAVVPLDRHGGSWEADPLAADLLYDVDRLVISLLFVPTRRLDQIHSIGDLLAAPPVGGRNSRRVALRRRVTRLIIDNPVVYDADLSTEERSWLRSEHRSLAATLSRFLGAELERRSDGTALIGSRSLCAFPFPDTGTLTQACLLVIDRIRIALEAGELAHTSPPSANQAQADIASALDVALPPMVGQDDEVLSHDAGLNESPDDTPPGHDPNNAHTVMPFVADVWLQTTIEELTAEHHKSFSGPYRASPITLANDVATLLCRFDLARPTAGGLVVMPVAARYRSAQVKLRKRKPVQESLWGNETT